MVQWLYLYFMCACARACARTCAFARARVLTRVMAVPLFLRVTQMCLDLACARACVCVNVRVALCFIVTLICGRLHQVSQDAVNLAGQTALEIDTHARVCVRVCE